VKEYSQDVMVARHLALYDALESRAGASRGSAL
jgi:hypothetical protein